MWINRIILGLFLLICSTALIGKKSREWIKLNYKLVQAIGTIGTVFALLFGFISLNMTRDLFITQNQPYIGIKELIGRNIYSVQNNEIRVTTAIVLCNWGNLPGTLNKISFTLGYQSIQIDTLLVSDLMLFPRDTIEISLRFDEDILKRFFIEINNFYKPNNGFDYVSNLLFQYELTYSCDLFKGNNYSSKSLWRHYSDCDKYERIK
jgi:hypothetical protein